MSQNGLLNGLPKCVYFKNLAANAARFWKCVWPFWDIMHLRVKTSFLCFSCYRASNCVNALFKAVKYTFIRFGWKIPLRVLLKFNAGELT